MRLAILFLICLFAFGHSQAQEKQPNSKSEKIVILKGRVLASVISFTTGAGIGPSYESFIFVVEMEDKIKRESFSPVKILYKYFTPDGSLKDEFFDYTKFYELKVTRDIERDESVKSISYVKNVDEDGKELPPRFTLRFSESSPIDSLGSDLVLPCYILSQDDYHVSK